MLKQTVSIKLKFDGYIFVKSVFYEINIIFIKIKITSKVRSACYLI